MSLRAQVLASFKKLHRTRQIVFGGDPEALKAGRLKINEEFSKHKDIVDKEEIAKLLSAAEEADDYLKTMVVQAKYNTDKDVYEVNLKEDTKLYENMDFRGGDDSEKFKKRRDRKSKNNETVDG